MENFQSSFNKYQHFDVDAQISMWIIVPSNNSQFYQLSRLLFFAALVSELFCTPTLILWPQYIPNLNDYLWTLDSIWLLNLLQKFITARPDVDSYETFEIGSAYVSSEFLPDLLSTLPSICFQHSKNTLFFRLLHILEAPKAEFATRKISAFVYPNSPIKQNTLT